MNNYFHENLKDIRQSKRFTQKEIAKVLGITELHYIDIENGIIEPSIIHIQKLCMVFDVSSDELLEPRIDYCDNDDYTNIQQDLNHQSTQKPSQNKNINITSNTKKRKLVYVIVAVILIAIIGTGSYLIKSCYDNQLIERYQIPASVADINLTFEKLDSNGEIKCKLIPYTNILDLKIKVYFFDINESKLSEKEYRIGDVKKNIKYNFTINAARVDIQDITSIESCSAIVTNGTKFNI